jgi:uncharacterized protein (TIGR04255 family)
VWDASGAESDGHRFLDRFQLRFHNPGVPLHAREIYPNAPLEFVACEVRFPYAPSLTGEDTVARLHRAFAGWLPVIEHGVRGDVTFVLNPAGVLNLAPGPPMRQVRFLSRDRTLSVLVAPNLVSVETTQYGRFEAFKDNVIQTLTALAQAEPPPAGLARIGLRYIDEVRVPGIDEVSGPWTRYIDERLAGPVTLRLDGASPVLLQGTLQFDLGEGRQVVMRYGAMKGQSVRDAPLRRRAVKGPGAYFLIDIDSFWEARDPMPEFSIDAALAICDILHRPVRELFEAAVTDRLRDEVLRRVPERD